LGRRQPQYFQYAKFTLANFQEEHGTLFEDFPVANAIMGLYLIDSF
jgi:hypothetical protein